MIGGIAPNQAVPQGTWLVGTGLIMLGLNVGRYVNGLRVSHFSLVLGVAIATQLAEDGLALTV